MKVSLKKQLITSLLAITLLCSSISPALAVKPTMPEALATPEINLLEENRFMETAEHAAKVLYERDLFRGIGTYPDGTPNFALDHSTNRHQAVTMLVRLLGKEEEALNGDWDIPFSDVDDWAKPYVGYAYANGLTNGTSPTTFSGNRNVTATQYLTFVLRALGYSSDSEVALGTATSADFRWNAAWELSDAIELTFGQYDDNTNTLFVTQDVDGNPDTSFKRGDVAIVSVIALNTKLKGSDKTLMTKLFPDYSEPNDPEPEKPTAENIAGVWNTDWGECWLRADGTYSLLNNPNNTYFSIGTYTVSATQITLTRSIFLYYWPDSQKWGYDTEKYVLTYDLDLYCNDRLTGHPTHDKAYSTISLYINALSASEEAKALSLHAEAYSGIIAAAQKTPILSETSLELTSAFAKSQEYHREAKKIWMNMRFYYIMHPEWQARIDEICSYCDKIIALPASKGSINTFVEYSKVINNLTAQTLSDKKQENNV